MSRGSGDLFDAAADARLADRGPLAARLRPRTLDDVVGQRHLVAPGAPLRTLIEADRLGSVILWGPPGTGKTTLARLVAEATTKAMVPLSAVAAGVKDVRQALEEARRRLGEQGRGTILFVDEVHRFNKAQQDVLLPAVEDGVVVLIGATTENPYFEVNAPLLSRATLWRLEPLTDDDLRVVAGRGLAAEGLEADEDAVAALVSVADGDARALLTTLEIAATLARRRAAARPENGPDRPVGPGEPLGADEGTAVARMAREDVSQARDGRLFHQGVDDHYDQASAFIKSVRGSDPDAGLYWLARMLDAGEDPRFLARRLVILASEDVGLADPMALVVADAAARALEFVGLPEAALNLAEATVYLACAPKSNRVTTALGRAREDVRRSGGSVPPHLRGSYSAGALSQGHDDGYRYPHDAPEGWVPQQYRPDQVEGHVYYEPSAHGAEGELGEVLRERRRRTNPLSGGPRHGDRNPDPGDPSTGNLNTRHDDTARDPDS